MSPRVAWPAAVGDVPEKPIENYTDDKPPREAAKLGFAYPIQEYCRFVMFHFDDSLHLRRTTGVTSPITLIDPGHFRCRSAHGVPLLMDQTYLRYPGSGPADRSIAADVLFREEPDEEEEDEEEHDGDEEDDNGDEGYSE